MTKKKTKADRLELALAEALWLIADVYMYVGRQNPRGKKTREEQVKVMDALSAISSRRANLVKAKTWGAVIDTDAVEHWAGKVRKGA